VALPTVETMAQTPAALDPQTRRTAVVHPSGAVPWRAVGLYTALSLGLAWLAALPLWTGGGLQHPAFTLIAAVVMTTPAIAGAIVTFGYLRPASPWRYLGLSGGPWRRTLGWALGSAAGAVGLTGAMLVLAQVLGLVDLRTGPDTISSLLLIPVLTLLIGLTAVGEEIGWRGFLHSALRALGPVRALLLNGAVWGVWHTPLLLLGYNYATTSPVSIPLMIISTVLIGTALAWLRERSGGIWAGALTHGALNVSASYLMMAFVPLTQQTPTLSLLGWVGWIVMGAFLVVLVAAGGFRSWTRRR
jgi:membrane protease YdiL (CAAX protease family)